MVEDIISNPCLFSPAPWVPMADVYEDDQKMLIMVDIAGIDRDEIKVTLDGRTIHITGSRPSLCPSESVRIRQMEIDTGTFTRRIVLPEPVIFEKIECTYKDGFLRIVLPKRAKGEAIRIPVESE